jgi:hypothetical protein
VLKTNEDFGCRDESSNACASGFTPKRRVIGEAAILIYVRVAGGTSEQSEVDACPLGTEPFLGPFTLAREVLATSRRLLLNARICLATYDGLNLGADAITGVASRRTCSRRLPRHGDPLRTTDHKRVLTAIVWGAVTGLVDVDERREISRFDRTEFFVAAAAFLRRERS